jgi:hypothetical protein
MSNNFDGPIILDSAFNNVTEPGYFGTGGRTGETSDGPRLSGGTPAEQAGVVAPAGSLFMTTAAGSNDATLLQQRTFPSGSAWFPIAIGGGGAIVGSGTAAVAAQTQAIVVTGALPGDIATATLVNDDTGGPLGAITACAVTADTVTVTFTNAVTTASSGNIQCIVVR